MPDNKNDSLMRKEHFSELNKFMPLRDKINYSKQKIEEFLSWCKLNKYKEVLVSFSGGKDSTVLFDLVFQVHKNMNSKIYLIPAYAIEITFPSTIKFIKDVVKKYQQESPYVKDPYFARPKMQWVEILQTKGYPIYSKQVSTMLNRVKRSKTKNLLTRVAFGIEDSARYKLSKNRLFLLDSEMTNFIDQDNKTINYFFSEKCCDFVKGGLKHDKRPSFVGTMANESLFRKQSWIKFGCNVFSKHHPMSRPMSLWDANDVWEYIKINNIDVNDAYGYDKNLHNTDKLRFSRLGCTSCPLGSSIEEYLANKHSENDELCEEYKYQNRFEKLLQYSQNLYESQIWRTGMYRILMDMNVKIRNDSKYMQLFYERRKQIDEWYKNLPINLIRVMVQVEQSKSNTTNWHYDLEDFNKAQAHYKTDYITTMKEIEEIREYERNKSKK